MILVTGGAGFIGSNFILDWLRDSDVPVINLDKVTYAGNPANLSALVNDRRYRFAHGDICDRELVTRLLSEHQPQAIVHFAAESHVDRSIRGPADFIQTNINGTFTLLEAAREYWAKLPTAQRTAFRFLQVSTDEVYGSLEASEPAFTEHHPYQPNSPYSASKAAADHLVRAYHQTYGLPTLTTNSSNNYGPLQFPEKLVPLMIVNGASEKALPVYGDGLHRRDWIYVSDHVAGIRAALAQGHPGHTYNIGGGFEACNIDIVKKICELLDVLSPTKLHTPHDQLISFVTDRPGHDRRYAIDASKIKRELGWSPSETFSSGLRKTVMWYLENQAWVEHVQSGAYQEWMTTHYANQASI